MPRTLNKPTLQDVRDNPEYISEDLLRLFRIDGLLYLVNGLPAHPPSFDELRESVESGLDIDVSEHVREYVFERPFQLPRINYQHLLDAKRVLTALTELKHPQSVPTTLSNVAMYWRVDNKGQISVAPGELVTTLEGLSLNRIKRCVNCSKWFYARRRDKAACSNSCAASKAVKAKRRKDKADSKTRSAEARKAMKRVKPKKGER